MSAQDLGALVSRLEAVTQRLEKVQVTGHGSSGTSAEETPLWYDDYVKIHGEDWVKFINDSLAQGGDVATLGALVKKAFDAHTNLLKVACRYNIPVASDLQAVFKPLSEAILAVQDFRQKNRGSTQFNFLSALSEAIPFLGWVSIAPKPATYVLQMEESAQFYTNKILKEFRQSEPVKADWSKSLIKLLKNFQQYIKDNHGTGLLWNKDKPAATPINATAVSKGAPPPPPPPSGIPPPPPPGGMQPPAAGGPPSKTVPAQSDTSALFSQINQGGNITKGLKPVSDEMKTHKNPALRSSATVGAPRPYTSPALKRFTAPESKKAPVFELQSKKWLIEHQEGNQNLVIDGIPEQTLYMFKCNNSVLQVRGKVNSITLDSCKKCGVVFEDLISTVEFINCQSVKAQANGTVPTVSIDKTDGAQVFLNEKSLNTQIVTAKSSEMNICIQSGDGDIKEIPIPEQFITVWDASANNFKTNVMALNM